MKLKDDFYTVHELSAAKAYFPTEKLKREKQFAGVAETWAMILAAAHVRGSADAGARLGANDFPAEVAKLLRGNRAGFVKLASEVAQQYAALVEEDYKYFKAHNP
jgi:hypothetical protein